jgi:hypothetical protein
MGKIIGLVIPLLFIIGCTYNPYDPNLTKISVMYPSGSQRTYTTYKVYYTDKYYYDRDKNIVVFKDLSSGRTITTNKFTIDEK